MGAPIAPNKPKLTHAEALAILAKNNVPKRPFYLLAVRGYFKTSMGHKEQNDVGMYDDAIFIVTDKEIVPFNFNCDPSRYRPGHGFGSAKGMASLQEGFWEVHMMAKHKGKYDALTQLGGKVTVRRSADAKVPAKDVFVVDGVKFYSETGEFGINLHMGGLNGTSSEGCMTWPQSQYWDAMHRIYKIMIENKVKRAPLLLVKF